MAGPLRIGIVGAGPRGLTVLERLVAHTAHAGTAAEAPRSVRIHVLDPFPPGAGRVWQTGQSPHLLMNTVVEEQTVFPDSSCRMAHTGTGPSMAAWAAAEQDAEQAAGPGAEPTAEQASAQASVPTAEQASAQAADPARPAGVFAPRRTYGRYLSWSWDRITSRAPAHVRIVHEPVEVTAVHDAPTTSGPATAPPPGRTTLPPQTLSLSDGRTLEVDAVVLCVGHIPAAVSDERAEWQRFARDAGLTYLPPGLPAETPVDRLQAGEPVLIRGFGLNFFDLQSLLTHGRGGTFLPADGDGSALTYVPSGDEPVLVPGSRRGVPYRSKPITPAHPLPMKPSGQLQFFTRSTVDRLPVRGDGLRFDEQLWPIILADLRFAWYSVLARTRPDAFAEDPAKLLSALRTAVDRVVRADSSRESERWHIREERVLKRAVIEAEPDLVFDMRRLLRPLGDDPFPHREALRGALMGFLRADLAESLAGPERSPLKALFPVLWRARALLKELVADDRLSPASFVRDVRGWFEDFVSGMCDGPPPQRFAELIALADAGLVDFAGPQVRITPSRSAEAAAFVATSPAVPGALRARALIDASSPANRVLQADDTLIRGMMERGQLRAAVHELEDGTRVQSTGLAVTESPYRTVDAHDRIHPARHCLSIQLSSVQMGLAIAANPDSDAQTLRDADAVARAVLGLD